MAGEAIQVEGARTLRRTLKAAGVGVEDLKAAHRQVAEQVRDAARPRAPIGTGRTGRAGRLRDSTRASGTQSAAIVRAGGARIPYAGPIHWGWPRRNIAAQPWLTETAARTQNTWEATYLAALDKIIQSVEGAPGP